MKVVGMPWSRSSVPVGADREQLQKICWVRESATEREVITKIKALFSWGPAQRVKFYYASGRHLREASLKDLENASSWDCAAVRALMGSGSLYVCKESLSLTSSSSEEETQPKVTVSVCVWGGGGGLPPIGPSSFPPFDMALNCALVQNCCCHWNIILSQV